MAQQTIDATPPPDDTRVMSGAVVILRTSVPRQAGILMRQSSDIYMVDTRSIKDAKAYKMLRNRSNAYKSHPEHKCKSVSDRAALWDELKRNIEQNGFDRDKPITIQILRKDGRKDQIHDGHHRFAIALELGITSIPVRFLYDE